MTFDTTVLLPLDQATVVIPTPTVGTSFEFTPEITLKHRDGELIRMNPRENDHPKKCLIQRRDELAVSWWTEGETILGDAAATIADMQAYGFRRDGSSATLLDTGPIEHDELVEIEPLDRGGIIVDSNQHLPVVLHRRDHSFWRARLLYDGIPDEIAEGSNQEYAYVVERRDEGDESWRVVEAFHSDWGATGVVEELGKAAGIEVVTDDSSSDRISSALDGHVFWFNEAAESEREQSWRERFGIQDRTVLFEDDVPDSISFDE